MDNDLFNIFKISNSGFSRTETGLIIDNEFPRHRSVERFKEATARNGFPMPENLWGLNKQINYFLDQTREQIPIVATLVSAKKVFIDANYESQGIMCLTKDYLFFSACRSLPFGNKHDNFEYCELKNVFILDGGGRLEIVYNQEDYTDRNYFPRGSRFVSGDENALTCLATATGRLKKIELPPPAPPSL